MLRNILINNIIHLYILTVIKILLPLSTLPYLTRIFSVEIYGLVAYVKAILGYVQVVVDYGFMFSATRLVAIASKEHNGDSVSAIVSKTLWARVLLVTLSGIALFVFSTNNNILKSNIGFVVLMFVSTSLTIFWMDFYFRGIEKMEVITYRFLISKIISTVMIFILVKSDADLLLMAWIEIFGNAIAAMISLRELIVNQIRIYLPRLDDILDTIKYSSVYFFSTVASTSFNIFITFLVGLHLTSTEVAFWSLAMQVVFGVQMLYGPITDALYPRMIKNFSKELIHKILLSIMPLVFIGCGVLYYSAELLVTIVAGEKYIPTAGVLVYLLPVLIASFPAILFGWPILGAKGFAKKVTTTTIIASIAQVLMLLGLLLTNQFNLINIAIARSITEIVFAASRFIYIKKLKII